jgi:threonine-phosphate decarboxylase
MANLAFEHGGNIYEIERKYKRKFLDFSANINPLGLPQQVKIALYKNFERILHYPDSNAPELIKKISDYLKVNNQNILLGNGSTELIYLIVNAFKPKTVLIPIPTFSEYEHAARNIKSRIKFINLYEKEDFKLNPTRLGASDIVFLSNPNNPTGNLVFTDSRLVEKLNNKLIIIDEVFIDFLPDEKKYSLIWKAVKSKRIIVLRSFTKFFALPGLRIGYLIAHKDIIKILKKYQIPWNVNALALKAAECILTDKSYIDKTRQFIEKERDFLFKEIIQIKNLKPYPSVTNFLLIKIEDKNLTSTLLAKRLIQKGILIRDCANFRGLDKQFIRVAVRRHRENIELVEALKDCV